MPAPRYSNLDAIDEFRIITRTSTPSTENSAGARSTSSPNRAATHSTATRSISAQYGPGRAQLFFSHAAFRQNQFGGTLGGPIRHDKIFFFTDYQGTRQTQGIDTGTISVPSSADAAATSRLREPTGGM